MPDEELVKSHDEMAKNTTTSLDYFREELVRRENNRQTEHIAKMTQEMRDMTKGMLSATKLIAWLTVFIAILTITNVALVAFSIWR